MGNTGSTPKNETVIMDEMSMYAGIWNSRDTKGTQTEVFRNNVPSEKINFTGIYKDIELDNIFTSDKIQLEMQGPYNSIHLYRDSLGETALPIYSNNKYTVQHPLGEPGRDLGDGHSSKVSHLMIVKHSDGPILYFLIEPPSSIGLYLKPSP